MLYDSSLQNSDMIFDTSSKFFVEKETAYVNVSCLISDNLPEQFSKELVNKFKYMLNISPDGGITNLVFTVSEVLDRIDNEQNQKEFVYLLFKTMFISWLCPDLANLNKLTEKKLKYHKARFVNLLRYMPINFANLYINQIYSSIVDTLETLINAIPKEDKYFKYSYRVALIAKEYIDDLVAFACNKYNSGRPRINKKLYNERPYEAVIKLANMIKNN